MEYFDDSDDEQPPGMFRSLDTDGRRKRNRRRELYSLDETSSRSMCDNQLSVTHTTHTSRNADEEAQRETLENLTHYPDNVSRLYSSLNNPSRPQNRQLYSSKSKSCDIASPDSTVDKLYKNYRQCRQCHQTDVQPVLDDEGKMLMMHCKNCKDGFGVDDSMSPDILLELYQQGCIEVQVGCCKNTDPDQFKIEGFDGEHISVRCLECDKLSILSDAASGNFDARTRDSLDVYHGDEGGFICRCGNQDQTKMEVCVVNDEIRCVTCILCEESIRLPEAFVCKRSDANTPDPHGVVSRKYCPGEPNINSRSAGEIQTVECTPCNSLYRYLPTDDPKGWKTGNTDHGAGGPSVSKLTMEDTDQQCCAAGESVPKLTVDSRDQQHSAGGSSTPTSKTWAGWLVSAYKSSVIYLSQEKQPVKGSGKPQYGMVKQLSDLQQADHIMWDRYEGYSHHAIIVHVLPEINKIVVIHYNGPSPSSHKVKGKIVAEQLDPFTKGLGRLFVVEYANPLTPDEVLKHAYSRLGEVKYSLLSNNCEHFATWCKTGQNISSQVITVQDCLMKYGAECFKAAIPVPGSKPNNVSGRWWMEINHCLKDIHQVTEDRKAGRLTRDAYIEVMVKRVTRSMGGLGGLALAMQIPIPAGVAIGGTLGGMIGDFAGKQLGTLIVKGYNELGNAFGAKQTS